MWVVFGILSAISAAFVAIFGKLALTRLDPTFATGVRAVIMALFFVLILIPAGKTTLTAISEITGREWAYLVLAGLAGALSWLCYFAALKLGEASNVTALDKLSVIFVILFSAIILGEKLTWGTVIGAVLLIVGSILVALF